VREYLLGLHWDGVPRIDRWLIDHLGAENNALNKAFGAKWLIGCVARVMRPGCKLDTALILEGRQGLMKSTALSTLGSPWVTDHMPDLGSKDAMEHLQGVWIIELAELSSLSRVEAGRIKAFLSTPSDRFRPSYGRATANHPRQCGFAGSINPGGSGYLPDETGNRRFWCVKCAVDWKEDHRVDIPALAAQRDQLWAEAVHRYQQHEPWWLDAAAEAQAEAAAEERFENDSRESIIRNFLRGRSYTRMTELFSEPCLNIPTDRQSRGTQIEIGRIMTGMKWTRRRRRNRHQEREWIYLAPGKHLDDVRDE
jgi:putative DNA primase/helicase